MMRNSNISMTATVKRDDLVRILRDNLEKHAQIVREAREGYIARAKVALVKRLDELRNNKLVSLTFSTLVPPRDHSDVYRTSLKMLEMNVEDTVELEADEFRQLVMDEWGWSDDFLLSNRIYSATATREAAGKGLINTDEAGGSL